MKTSSAVRKSQDTNQNQILDRNHTVIRFGERKSTTFLIEISKGRRHEKEERERPKKEDTEETCTPEDEEVSSQIESIEGYSSVDLSANNDSEARPESKQSKGDQFLGRFKRSSVGKLFKGEAKNQDISIYTIDQSQAESRAKNHEERLQTNELGAKLRQNLNRPSETTMTGGRMRSVASQANSYPPYRLNFLPPPNWKESETKLQAAAKLIFCLSSIACFLLLWLITGALAFYLNEAPFEQLVIENLEMSENSTMVSMATDLRMLDPEEDPWDEVLIKYSMKHREEIFSAINKGYNNETTIWTFPGSLLSAISILTTMGLAAPLPQTTAGIISAIIFSFIGIPIHWLFIIHIGRSIAVRTQLFAKEAENKAKDWRQRIIHVRRFGEERKREMWPEQMFMIDFVPPKWLKYFSLASILIYYIIGLLIFGVARGLSPSRTFIFFIDFSRGYSSNGFSRMGFSWYLEGAAILIGLNIALLHGSPASGLTGCALPYGIVTNSID